MLSGNEGALARVITLIEQDSPEVNQIFQLLPPRQIKNAYCIGITGPPGAGKSTLIDKLITIIRSKGLSVAVIAVDPSSAITGGAVLGDRIRMQHHYSDREVFIRSMATRGNWGGLSKAVPATINLLDSIGKDVILIETVGVGQTEIEISKLADVVVVVSQRAAQPPGVVVLAGVRQPVAPGGVVDEDQFDRCRRRGGIVGQGDRQSKCVW